MDWLYWGDVDIKQGGMYIRPDRDYADIVEVVPLGEYFEEKEGVFVIRRGYVSLGFHARESLESSGRALADYPKNIRLHLLAEAIMAYAGMDIDESMTVKAFDGSDNLNENSMILHENYNDDLVNFVESVYNIMEVIK